MSSRDLRGRWHGTYTYDELPGGAPPGPPVNFEISITQNWLQRLLGLFRGTVEDDPTPVQQGTGRIRGHAWSGRIRFVKRMPVAFLRLEGRSILLSERLAELGHPGLPDRAGPSIHYAGKFEDPDRTSGRWVIPSGHLRVARGLWVRTGRTSGTWTMRRVD